MSACLEARDLVAQARAAWLYGDARAALRLLNDARILLLSLRRNPDDMADTFAAMDRVTAFLFTRAT